MMFETQAIIEAAMLKIQRQTIEECAQIVERWSLPTIQTPSMWLVDKAGIAAEIRALALPLHNGGKAQP